MYNLKKNVFKVSIVIFVLVILIIVTLFAGCGSETGAAAGGGLLGGFAASETLKGMQADLERREQALIAHYNELVEAGARADTLEQLNQEIEDTVRLRQTAQVADSSLSNKWDDPAAAGRGIAEIITVAYAWLKRKDLKNTVAGIRSFRAEANEETKHKLDQVMLDKKAVT